VVAGQFRSYWRLKGLKFYRLAALGFLD
jgi:hypothetical protein